MCIHLKNAASIAALNLSLCYLSPAKWTLDGIGGYKLYAKQALLLCTVHTILYVLTHETLEEEVHAV